MLRHLARVISLAPQFARLAGIEGLATVAPRIEGSSARLQYSKSWGTWASATRPSADASTTISAAASSSSAPAVSQYAQCWNCGESRGRRGVGFCGGCGKIQALHEDISPFAVLGMEETYDIDYFKLEDNYKTLQWNIHPDKFATASGQERELSTHNSTLINNAYRTLRCPLSRARYLLQRAGIDFGEGGEGTLEDPELLMEIMETREAVEDAASPVALMQLRRDNEGHRADVIGKLKEAFAVRDLATAQQLLIRLIYYARIGDEIKQRL